MSHTLAVGGPAIPVFLGQAALEPVRLSGQEGVNSLFEYELLLKTPDALNLGASDAANFNLDSFIGREVTCSIELDGSGMFVAGAVGAAVDRVGSGIREINALVAAAQFWGEEGRRIQYKLTLRPWLHLATLSVNCKVFQNKTVVEILDEGGAGIPDLPASQAFAGDELRHVVRFGGTGANDGTTSVKNWAGKPVMLHFRLHDAQLFSFAFRP